MRKHQLTALLIFAVIASGCTTQAWYAGTQRGAESECKHKPAGEVDRCLARLNKMSYEEYQQARAGKEL